MPGKKALPTFSSRNTYKEEEFAPDSYTPVPNTDTQSPINIQRILNSGAQDLTPPQVLRLQQTIGNKAVARLLARKDKAPQQFQSANLHPLQRQRMRGADSQNSASRLQPSHSISRIAGSSHAASFAAQKGVVQRARTPLTSDEVIGALKGMTFMKKHLKSKLHAGARELGASQDLDVMLKEERVDKQIKKVLENYDAHFAKKGDDSLDMRDAMMLSMALDGVARVIAERLNDVSVQSTIATKLFEVYRSKISGNLKSKKWSLRRSDTSRKRVLDLAQSLLAGNPVTQFMHQEINKSKAASEIIAMATEAKKTDDSITPLKMYQLMEQRFQAQMASFSQEQLHADKQDTQFSTREAHGEYSTYFFKQLFGEDTFSTKDDKADWNNGATTDRLAFTTGSEDRLKELRDEIQAPTNLVPTVLRPGVNTEKTGNAACSSWRPRKLDLIMPG